jgi:hypothetical protein
LERFGRKTATGIRPYLTSTVAGVRYQQFYPFLVAETDVRTLASTLCVLELGSGTQGAYCIENSNEVETFALREGKWTPNLAVI